MLQTIIIETKLVYADRFDEEDRIVKRKKDFWKKMENFVKLA